MIFHDPVYERALDDRDWAPPGGTSMNRARQLQHDFSNRFRDALRKAVDKEPGMDVRLDGGLPWVSIDGDERGGWWIGHGLSHEIRGHADDMPTFLWASYVTDAEDGPVNLPRPLDVTLTGKGARDVCRLARMVVEALKPYVAEPEDHDTDCPENPGTKEEET